MVKKTNSISLKNFDAAYSTSFNKFQGFFKLEIQAVKNLLTNSPPDDIEKLGITMIKGLIKNATKKLPAYKKFLHANHMNIKQARKYSSFKSLPIMTKDNYLKKYKMNEIGWNGVSGFNMISVSSGSTGEPFFWPRGLGLEYETALEHELFLKYFFNVDKKRTLFIIGYAMGMYVAGSFTLNSLMGLAKKGYPLTVVSPGSDKDSILRIVKSLGHNFDQIIISVYSPVLKDLVEKGEDEGIDWKKYNLKFISGGEGFSEEFRSYIYSKIGSKNYLTTSMNTYGSADAAILGHETPLSILIRKLATEDTDLKKAIFNDDRIPSLLQYYPFFKYFEEINGDLVFSSYGGVPLIRYSIGDTGGVIKYEQMIEILQEYGVDIKKEMNKYNCGDLIFKLPFVYLFGRKDNTKIFYGANIYPEHIKNGLEKENVILKVTGKYFTEILIDENHNQSLFIAIELISGIDPHPDLHNQLISHMHEHLLNVNAEYKYLSKTIGDRIKPTIELHSYGDPKYFAPGIKPKYVKKN